MICARVLLVGLTACSIATDLDTLRGTAPDAAALPIDATADTLVDAASDQVADVVEAGAPPCILGTGTTGGLVGYYNFDEGAGAIAHDCSGKKHDGVIGSVASGTWTSGVKGGGLRVAAPNGCVDLGIVPEFEMTSTGLTVMAWVATVSYPTDTRSAIVGKSSDLNVSGWRLFTGLGTALGAGVARADIGALLVWAKPAASWHHVTVVFDPDTSVTLYFDGKAVSTTAWNSAFVEDKQNVRIGCRGDGTGFYDGTLDEVRIYSRALTAPQVLTLATQQ